MGLTKLPSKTADSLGIDVRDRPRPFERDPRYSKSALEHNRLIDTVIALSQAVGVDDGSTPGSILEALAGAGVLGGIDAKPSVRVASTAAGTLASDFEAGDTIDGVVLAEGDRILIKDQAAAEENGIYVVEAAGAPTRADDLPFDSLAASAWTWVNEGATQADQLFRCTADADAATVGTDPLPFSVYGVGADNLQQAVDEQAGAVVTVDATKAVRLDNDTDTTPVLGLGGTAAARRVAIYDASGAVVLEVDAVGDVRTPDVTGVGTQAPSLTIEVGQGGPGDATPTSPGAGETLALRGGEAGADGGSGSPVLGGDLLLRSGLGTPTSTAAPGHVRIGAEFDSDSGPVTPGAGEANVTIWTGSEPLPGGPADIALKSVGDLSLEGNNIASTGAWDHTGALDVSGNVDVGGTLKGLTEVETEAGTSRTLADTDNGKIILTTASSTVTITVPALAVGVSIEIVQGGSGQVQLVDDTGVDLLLPSTFLPNTAEQNSSLVVTGVVVGSPSQSIVRGDLEAA